MTETQEPVPAATPPAKPMTLSLAVAGGAVAGLCRLLPLPVNFKPVGAFGVFSGARVPAWLGYVLMLGVMILSDFLLWVLSGFDPNYSLAHPSRPFIYCSMLLYVFIGRCVVNTESPVKIGLATILGSVQFFIISNFDAWIRLYPQTVEGLGLCYAAALPFFHWTLLSDLAFAAALFGVHAWLSHAAFPEERVPAPESSS